MVTNGQLSFTSATSMPPRIAASSGYMVRSRSNGESYDLYRSQRRFASRWFAGDGNDPVT